MIPALIARPLGSRYIYQAVVGEDAQVAAGSSIVSVSWATLQGNAGTSTLFTRTGSTMDAGLKASTTANQYRYMTRMLMAWDLSGESGTFVGGTLRLRITAVSDGFGGQSFVLTGAAPADPSAMVYEDFNNLDTTAYSATEALSGLSANSFLTLSLNAAAISAANTAAGSGYLSIGGRWESDRSNTEPTYASNEDHYIRAAQVADATVAYRPLLTLWK